MQIKRRHIKMARAAHRTSGNWDGIKYRLAYHELYAACVRVDRWHRAAKGKHQ